MNKENAHLYLPLVQALAEGKTIQYKQDGIWKGPLDLCFSLDADQYRIKPNPPRTFERYLNKHTGTMITVDFYIANNCAEKYYDDFERITVQEVLE